MSRSETLLTSLEREEFEALRALTPSLSRERWGELNWISICLLLFFSSLFTNSANSQVVLQLEKFNQVKTYKYVPGSSLLIRQKDYPDVWSRKVISQILVNDNTIVFEDLIIPLDDIIGVRHENQLVKGLSRKLYQFGIAWFAFGGVLHALDRFEIGTDTFLVGGGAFALGFGIKALFFRKTFTIGSNSRLRILDLNMYNSNFD